MDSLSAGTMLRSPNWCSLLSSFPSLILKGCPFKDVFLVPGFFARFSGYKEGVLLRIPFVVSFSEVIEVVLFS